MQKNRYKVGGILAILLAAVMPMHSVVASPADADTQMQQLLRDRQQAQERQQRRESKDVLLQQPVESDKETSLPEERVTFLVHEINLKGKYSEMFTWLAKEASRYNERKIGKEGLNVIVKRLNNKLMAKGYITSRVMIPEQDLSGGRLELTFIPGTIGEIQCTVAGKFVEWHTALPFRSGDILNLRDLEQGLEQLKRVPSQDADFQLHPGKNPGESNVVISVKRTKPWKVVFSMDDSGTKSTGKLQATTTIGIDNLMGINDLFNISFNRDVEGHRTEFGSDGSSWCWSFPYGYWTYSLSSRSNTYKQTLPNAGGGFLQYSGTSRTTEIKAERLMQRDKNSKTSVSLKLLQTHSRNYMNDTEMDVQRKDTVALEMGISQRRFCGKDIWDYQVAYRHGVPWFNAMAESPWADSPTSRYGIWTGEVNWTHPMKWGKTDVNYNMTLHGQYSNSVLFGVDCISIGNRYTVRGFDGEQTLAAEKGWYMRNELAFSLGKNGQEVYLGLDGGEVAGPGTVNLPGRQLIGATLGMRGHVHPGGYMDVFVGWPLKKPDGFTTENPTFGFQYSYYF